MNLLQSEGGRGQGELSPLHLNYRLSDLGSDHPKGQEAAERGGDKNHKLKQHLSYEV